MDLQFYPTPPELRDKAWAKFKRRNKTRLLEPSAGKGDLINGKVYFELGGRRYESSMPPIDVIEMDVTQHPLLKSMGFNVIGVDFMAMENGAMYSHIILNPPFLQGVNHVLHAWDIMYDGEIVAIINARSIRNLKNKERVRLAKLIEEYGSVEFLEEEFVEAERKTNVEIALIHLEKKSDFFKELVGDILNNLKKEREFNVESEFEESENTLAVPRNFIENQVLAFKAAVEATKQSIFANARNSYYVSLLGRTMEKMEADANDYSVEKLKDVQQKINVAYADLKNRAWTSIITSSEATSRLSSKAKARLDAEFETIKTLEFNASNVYGLLYGLCEKQGEIQEEMLCDIFDLIGKYHSDNLVFYCGYKSNDKHRTLGLKLKTTRFVIPNNKSYGSFSSSAMSMLRDFDKAFAMLDGKHHCEVSLESLFSDRMDELRDGKRLSGSYFDVRYFKGVGTIHFFPKSEKLMDALNRYVGKRRQWLPNEFVNGSEEYWAHYDMSEKVDKEVRESVLKNHKQYSRWSRDPFWFVNSNDDTERNKISNEIFSEVETVMKKRGIDVMKSIDDKSGNRLLEAS